MKATSSSIPRRLPREGASARRRVLFIGAEFGTVSRSEAVGAAREPADAGFDAVIACAFNYEAHAL